MQNVGGVTLPISTSWISLYNTLIKCNGPFQHNSTLARVYVIMHNISRVISHEQGRERTFHEKLNLTIVEEYWHYSLND